MRKFPCVFMRGGTSKGCMFLESDLPARDQWDDIFVQAMGSPDPKQIDGMGGCVSSNNKIVVVRKSDRPGIDVDYIVGQSIVGQSKIDYKSNCGNMTAATAPYAVEMGLVEDLTEPTTVVHMFNLNTNKTIDVEVPIKDGQFNNEGTCSIAGVDGTAGELKVNFLDPAGAKTGKLFPTGNARETLDLGELGTIEATILDVSNPMVLVRAADLGITGTQLPAEVDADKALAAKLEAIRGVAAFVPGTLVHELVVFKPGQQTVRIGHPSGVMTMYPYLDDPTKPLNDIVVSGVAVQRTARRIMDGTLYIRK